MKLWKDITQDAQGKYVAKDVFKATSFVGGYGIVVAAAVADFLAGRGLSINGAISLLVLAFGIQLNKDWASIAHRKVEVEAGCEDACVSPESTAPEAPAEGEKQAD